MDIRERFERAPISHTAGAVLLLAGTAIVGLFVYHLATGGDTLLTMKEFAVYGPGNMVAGGILWSRFGTVVDIVLGFAEKKADEA